MSVVKNDVGCKIALPVVSRQIRPHDSTLTGGCRIVVDTGVNHQEDLGLDLRFDADIHHVVLVFEFD